MTRKPGGKAKDNPRETYQTKENHEKCVRLKLNDLELLELIVNGAWPSKSAERIKDEFDRAIAAHGKAAK